MGISNAFDSFLFPDKRTKDLANLKFWHQRVLLCTKVVPKVSNWTRTSRIENIYFL